MHDYAKQPVADGDIHNLGTWHRAALKIYPFVDQKVIDVGCGTGCLLYFLRDTAQMVTGIDPNPLNIKVLREHHIPGIAGYLEENLEQLRDYDVATCFEVIEHLYSSASLLSAMYKVLNQSGTAIVSTPNAFNLVRAFLFLFKQEHHDPLLDPTRAGDAGHIRLWSAPMLERALRQAGFRKVRVYGLLTLFGRLIILKIPLFVRYFSQNLICVVHK